MTQLHEWVTGFRDFEAVLRVTNKLQEWDAAATLRAFQTFGFDDASTPGNGYEYSHAESGVIVRHDGEFVAIEFGGGDLAAALADLVHVLHQLGWKEAEVFHPAESLGAFLNDVGMAIPAGMAFDVKGADTVTEISGFAESTALVGMGRKLLQTMGNELDMNDLVLGELASMGDELRGVPASTSASRHALLPEDEAPVVPVLSAGLPERQQQAFHVLDDGFPARSASHAHYDIPGFATEDLSDHPAWRSEGEGQGADVGPETAVQLADLPAPSKAASHPHADLPQGATPAGDVMVHVADAPEPAEKTPQSFRAGNATFVVARKGDAHDLSCNGKVIYCWPGASDERIRWDVLGEFDPKSPWFAEALAAEMGFFDIAEAACFAHGLARVATVVQGATLRTVVEVLADAGARAQHFGPLLAVIDEKAFVRDAIARLSGVLLYAPGTSFVEPGSESQSFSIRSLMGAAEERTYVVHLDDTDGATTGLIVRLLFKVASRWASSSKASEQADVMRQEAEARRQELERRERDEEARRVAQAKAQEIAGQLRQQMEKLREMGIDISDVKLAA